MRDLLADPMCGLEDLGAPLPPSPYAVSVCLPTWDSVVGYEENDPAIVGKMKNGYPRFFISPVVQRLIEGAERELAAPGERALLFPRPVHAERCARFVKKYGKGKARAAEYGGARFGVALFPAGDYETARLCWRFCGELVSPRQAEAALAGLSDNVEEGIRAEQTIKERLADFAGQQSEGVFLFPSGMAAIFAVHRMLTALFPSRKTAQVDFPYVDTLKVQEYFGVGVHFLPFAEESDYARLETIAGSEGLAGIFVEVPSNPLLRCVDLRRIGKIAAERQIPIIIDDTAATSVNIDSFRFADVTTTSLTKVFSGSGDVFGGAVILRKGSPHYAAFKSFLDEHHDGGLWPGDAIALEKNSHDFAQRVGAMSETSLALFDFLSKHPKIGVVYHSLNYTDAYEQVRKPEGGHAPLFSFVLKDTSKTPALYDHLELCKGPSLGTNFTLICPYTLLAHYGELDWAEKNGVNRHLIRVAVGLEPADVLIERFKQALDSI